MNTVQMIFEMQEGMDEEKFFEEINRAVNPVLKRYEDAGFDTNVSAYIVDDKGRAIY